MTGVGQPVVIIRGEPTFPFLVAAAERLAAAMPDAELVVVPESHDHAVDPEATARLVRERIA
jgi:pimeloyl-ACP methyl ester carboxylesterase